MDRGAYVNTEAIDICPFVKGYRLSTKYLPRLLYYKRYIQDQLWCEDSGLWTRPHVVGVHLGMDFFKETVRQHLLFPVHEPWVFSPYISVTSSFNDIRGIRVSNHAQEPSVFPPYQYQTMSHEEIQEFDAPHHVLVIDLKQRTALGERYVFSVAALIKLLDLPLEVYEHRPGWRDEYLVLRHVPIELITIFEPDDFENRFGGAWQAKVVALEEKLPTQEVSLA